MRATTVLEPNSSNAHDTNPVKAVWTTVKLAAWERIINNKPPYRQKGSRNATDISVHLLIRLPQKWDRQALNPSPSRPGRVSNFLHVTQSPASGYTLKLQWTRWRWQPLTRAKKVSIVGYRQPWRTRYSALCRESWTRRSSQVDARMQASIIPN